MPNESQKFLDNPKMMMQTPNMATLPKSFGPTLLFSKGSEDRKNIITRDPIPCADRNQPNSIDPAFNTFSTTAGSKDSAPPKKTANISRLRTAKMMGVAHMNFNPCFIRSQGDSVDSASSFIAGFGVMRRIITMEMHIKTKAVPNAISTPNPAMSNPPANGPRTEPIINADELSGMAFS